MRVGGAALAGVAALALASLVVAPIAGSQESAVAPVPEPAAHAPDAPAPDALSPEQRLARAATPLGALAEVTLRPRGGPRDLDVAVDVERAPFRWRLRPADGAHLSCVEVIDLGVVARVLEGARLVGAELADAQREGDGVRIVGPGGAVTGARHDGAALVVAYEGDVEVRYTPHGRALAIDLSGPAGVAYELVLDGALGVADAQSRRLAVPGADQGAVHAVITSDGVRYSAAWIDLAVSNATSRGIAAGGSVSVRYLANGDNRFRELRERVWVVWSDELADVLPSLDRPAAPERAAVAPFHVELVAGGAATFAELASAVERLAAHGVKDAQLWLREWSVPSTEPDGPPLVARDELGGWDGLRALAETATAAGFALGLDQAAWGFAAAGTADAALTETGIPRETADGRTVLAAGAALERARAHLADLAARVPARGASVGHLGALLPRADFDARHADWGLPRATWAAHRELAELVRATFGAPLAAGQMDAGTGSLLWAGEFEVALRQLPSHRDPWSERALLPQHYLSAVRPRTALVGLSPAATTVELADELRAWHAAVGALGGATLAEADLTAIDGTAPTSLGRAVRDAWLTGEGAARLADPARRVREVRYRNAEGRWLSLSEALAAGHALARGSTALEIEWDDGGRVWINSTPEPLDVTSPIGRRRRVGPWGHLVHYPDLEAGLVETRGAVYDVSRGPRRFAVDTRGVELEVEQLRLDGAIGLEIEGQQALHPLPDAGRGPTRRIALSPSWVTRLASQSWATWYDVELTWSGPALEPLVELVRCDEAHWLELTPARWLEQGYTRVTLRSTAPPQLRPMGH